MLIFLLQFECICALSLICVCFLVSQPCPRLQNTCHKLCTLLYISLVSYVGKSKRIPEQSKTIVYIFHSIGILRYVSSVISFRPLKPSVSISSIHSHSLVGNPHGLFMLGAELWWENSLPSIGNWPCPTYHRIYDPKIGVVKDVDVMIFRSEEVIWSFDDFNKLTWNDVMIVWRHPNFAIRLVCQRIVVAKVKFNQSWEATLPKN